MWKFFCWKYSQVRLSICTVRPISAWKAQLGIDSFFDWVCAICHGTLSCEEPSPKTHIWIYMSIYCQFELYWFYSYAKSLKDTLCPMRKEEIETTFILSARLNVVYYANMSGIDKYSYFTELNVVALHMMKFRLINYTTIDHITRFQYRKRRIVP